MNSDERQSLCTREGREKNEERERTQGSDDLRPRDESAWTMQVWSSL